MKNKYQISSIKNQNDILKIKKNSTFYIIFAFCILIFNITYGIWGISQDVTTRGAGNVGYTGYLTLPLYLSTQAKDTAIYYEADNKFKTYGGYIQYGVTDKIDVGLHGNSSINSSIGLNVKYQPVDNIATLVGFDYEMNEMVLAPFGVLMAGANINKNFSAYGGVKAFQWSKMIIQESPQNKENTFGTVLYAGLHIYRKEGWKDTRYSFLPTGLYVELAYPVSVDSKCLTLVLGLDGFLGFSFPRLQW